MNTTAVEAILSSSTLPSIRTRTTALGCCCKEKRKRRVFIANRNRSVLIPPVVEPAQPQTIETEISSTIAVAGQTVVSAVANPAVEISDTT